ncbi:MAG: tetratricopeptide repeat protein [Spirochaetota bacterium]
MLISILCVVPAAGFGEAIQKGDMLFTPHAGYSNVRGIYEEQLNDGQVVGLSFRYLVHDIVFLGAGINYSSWNLRYSEESSMRSYGLYGGGGLMKGVSIFSYTAYPYGGLFYKESFLRLETDRLGEKKRTYKPGVLLRAGVEFPVVEMVSVQMAGEYSILSLSDRSFATSQWTFGVTYNPGAFTRWRESKRELDEGKLEMYMTRGIKQFEMGEIDSAEGYFSMVLSLEKDHTEAEDYMRRISKIKSTYRQAKDLASDEQYYQAISLLSSIRDNHNDARALIKDIREKVAEDVPGLVEEGIAAYRRKNYEKCITIMDRVLVFDPDNRMAKIYYTRALKRKEALEKLR